MSIPSSAGRFSLSAGLQLLNKDGAEPYTSILRFTLPARGPSSPALQRSKSGLLMPKTNVPCHNGRLPNRRRSRAPVGACGSKRVSLTLTEHRAYSFIRPVISDLTKTLTLYTSHGAPSSGLLVYHSMPCGEEKPGFVSRPDIGPGLHAVPQL